MSGRARAGGVISMPSPSFPRPWRGLRWCGLALWGTLAVLFFLAAPLVSAQTDVVSEINVQGNRRIPADTIKARIFTKAGDIYDAAALERDFNSL